MTIKRNQLGHQARKAKTTRDNILNAVVILINKSGYSSATSTAISKQAGITWGAVQHHYGNKEEIMLAVMQLAENVYIDSLNCPQLTSGPLEQRISLFIDKVWEHYKSDLYFAFSEIIMACRGSSSKISLQKVRMNRRLKNHLKTMADIFDGYDVPSDKLNEELRYAHRFLAGFAIDRIFDPQAPFEDVHIQRIKNGLLAIIQAK